jgi:hypothetical protein
VSEQCAERAAQIHLEGRFVAPVREAFFVILLTEERAIVETVKRGSFAVGMNMQVCNPLIWPALFSCLCRTQFDFRKKVRASSSALLSPVIHSRAAPADAVGCERAADQQPGQLPEHRGGLPDPAGAAGGRGRRQRQSAERGLQGLAGLALAAPLRH